MARPRSSAARTAEVAAHGAEILGVFEYRVTKYDPAHRDAGGLYTLDDWTSVSDIGKTFDGVVLTEPEYQRREDAYVAAAEAFMSEVGVSSLTVCELENHASVPLAFGDGAVIALARAGTVVRRVLREEFWCRLESEGGFIHLGYDFYMYVGVAQRCLAAETLAGQLGLYVEAFNSPYRERHRAEFHAPANQTAMARRNPGRRGAE